MALVAPPVVTGISPKEGPPGTRVTLRGENLGIKPNDLEGLTICDSECLLSAEWKSPNKIIARSGPGKGRGDIIVTTKSGGRGTCTVQFKGYYEAIGPLKESAVWIDEAPLQNLSWGSRTLSHSTYHLEDPLGLSVEENERKFPEDELREMFPDGSGDLASDNFEPGWFLLEHHHATSFDDLKVGLSYLKRKIEGQKEGQLSFLKDNVSSVMEQMDTLFLLKEKFEEDFSKAGLDSTAKAANAIEESMREAHKLFEDVLTRREKADATCNALAVLNRYKFIFCLPARIEHNIKQGDFDLVVSDYSRAKNLFSKSETIVFKNVLMEVERQIEDLKRTLKSKLSEMPTSLEEQRKIIRNLVTLGTDGDPGWEAILNSFKYLNDELPVCLMNHIAIEQEQLRSEGKSRRSGSSGRSDKRFGTTNQVIEMQNTPPQRVLFLEDVVELLIQFLPEIWKLGLGYFNGELHVKPNKSKQIEFKEITMKTIKSACELLSDCILDTYDEDNKMKWTSSSEITDALSTWLPHCLRYVRDMYITLANLDITHDALNVIANFLLKLRVHCMNCQLKQVAEEVKLSASKENWKLQFNSEFGATTQLPMEFEKLVLESIQRIKESCLQSEKRELSVMDTDVVKREFNNLVNKIFNAFIKNLEVLGMVSEDHDHSIAVSQLIGSPFAYSGRSTNELSWEHRLLAMLSNCQYTRIVIFPKFTEQFRQHGFPSISESVKENDEALCLLEKRMVETYVELKSDPLVGTIEPSMYLGHFDWDSCPKPIDVRPYAKEIITNLTAVHAEVQRLVPKLLYTIVSQIVETIAEELSRLMSCVTKFNHNGCIQARIDTIALKDTFNNFATENAKIFFNEALTEAIPKIRNEDERIVREVLQECRRKMRLQSYCFISQNL